ncbi:MAG: pantetheine-phosphate adenylyltransferase [Parvibaculales bacterium]
MFSGFYPGSFDPPTVGHVDVLKRAMNFLDRLVVGIGINAEKKAHFTVAERRDMLLRCLSDHAEKSGCSLEIISFEGLLVDAAQNHDARLIIRGLRNGVDFDYEAQMSAMNRKMSQEVETVCMASAPEVAQVSSTLVRQIADMGGDFSAFVPSEILDTIKLKYK